MHEPPLILLVDDEPEVLLGTSLRVQAAGFRTMTAANGPAALELVASERPDAIVLDVRMPGPSGLAVLKKLRHGRCTGHVPVVMLSASLRDRKTALDAGARFFLTKPYEGHALLEAIRAALGQPAQETDVRAICRPSPEPVLSCRANDLPAVSQNEVEK